MVRPHSRWFCDCRRSSEALVDAQNPPQSIDRLPPPPMHILNVPVPLGGPEASTSSPTAFSVTPGSQGATDQTARAQADMNSTPKVKEAEGQKLAHNAPESPAGVSCAASRPEIVPATYLLADTQMNAPTGMADTIRAAGSAANWTLAQKLEFIVLWLSIELSTTEIADYFDMSERHLRRLRADFGLDTRSAIRRLDRPARLHLVFLEEFSAFMPLRGQELLRVAQQRRRAQDAVRDTAATEEARRRWRWRRSPESGNAKRLRDLRSRLKG